MDTASRIENLGLVVRPLERSDREALGEFFAGLSAESLRRRFFTPKPSVSPRAIAYLADVDHVNHEAMAAVAPDGALVGVARYVPAGEDVAEMAVTVTDAWHGRGIGGALARLVLDRARQNSIAKMAGTTLWENRAARALLAGLGFRACGSDGRAIDFELDLGPAQAAAAVAS